MLLGMILLTKPTVPNHITENPVDEISKISSRDIYNEISESEINFEAFDLAYKGWMELKDSLNLKKDILAIADFSKPSNIKRYFVIDMKKKEVIHKDYVAHGKNTGELWAKNFSNIPNSNKSSLGFYKTAETYFGKHGLSLKLDGLEKGINNKARERAIVMHSANYAKESFIKKYGRLGRSFGCPALPPEGFNKIIETIKEGSILFIYHPEGDYSKISTILN